MALREILKYGSETLHQPSTKIEKIDDSILQLIADMIETMHYAPGVGLAAPQVGVNKRAIVIDLTVGEDPEAVVALINPEIIESCGSELGEEGCLSVPGIFSDVERPSKVKVKALNTDGVEVIIEAEEYMARALCHEIDHLEGVVFVDRLSPLKKRFVKKDISKKIENGDWQD